MEKHWALGAYAFSVHPLVTNSSSGKHHAWRRMTIGCQLNLKEKCSSEYFQIISQIMLKSPLTWSYLLQANIWVFIKNVSCWHSQGQALPGKYLLNELKYSRYDYKHKVVWRTDGKLYQGSSDYEEDSLNCIPRSIYSFIHIYSFNKHLALNICQALLQVIDTEELISLLFPL